MSSRACERLEEPFCRLGLGLGLGLVWSLSFRDRRRQGTAGEPRRTGMHVHPGVVSYRLRKRYVDSSTQYFTDKPPVVACVSTLASGPVAHLSDQRLPTRGQLPQRQIYLNPSVFPPWK